MNNPRVFIADETRISPGTQYWAKSFGVLAEPIYLKEGGDYYVVKFEDSPIEDVPLFYVGDHIYIKGINWSSGIASYTVYFKVTSIWMQDNKPYKYILMWIAGDNISTDIDPGSVFVNLGQDISTSPYILIGDCEQ